MLVDHDRSRYTRLHLRPGIGFGGNCDCDDYGYFDHFDDYDDYEDEHMVMINLAAPVVSPVPIGINANTTTSVSASGLSHVFRYCVS